jgi:hypothetical protein
MLQTMVGIDVVLLNIDQVLVVESSIRALVGCGVHLDRVGDVAQDPVLEDRDARVDAGKVRSAALQGKHPPTLQ